ncbi:MAG: hypothetical protein HPY55_11430 [Firmicutes bacterium]|nr:hypothetical protein [Bacillota bacterium]
MSRVIKSGDVALTEPEPLNLRVIIPFLREAPAPASGAPQVAAEATQGKAAKMEGPSPHEEADRVLREARERSEEILAEARAEAGRIKDVARLEGFELGQKEGFDEGLSRAEIEVEGMKKEAARLVEAARDEATRIVAAAEPKIAQIALAIARKVIKREVAADPEIVLGNVREALRRIGRDESVSVRTSPIEVSVVHEARKDLAREFDAISEINVEEDPSVGPGGCIVTTGRGTVDARIESQIDKAGEHLMEAVDLNGRAG